MGGIKRSGERGGSSHTAHETKLCMYSQYSMLGCVQYNLILQSTLYTHYVSGWEIG